MFGIKIWYFGGACSRCGRTNVETASPYWGAALNGVSWCAVCLRETGRTR